jgi:hypothetical protein
VQRCLISTGTRCDALTYRFSLSQAVPSMLRVLRPSKSFIALLALAYGAAASPSDIAELRPLYDGTRIVLSNRLPCTCAADSRQSGIRTAPTPGWLGPCRQPRPIP